MGYDMDLLELVMRGRAESIKEATAKCEAKMADLEKELDELRKYKQKNDDNRSKI